VAARRRIDLDHNATTRLHPEARARMEPLLDAVYGNPSSLHAEGRAARDAVERARAEVSALVGALAEEIVFTSGGTESIDLALRGTVRAAQRAGRGGHVITSAVEHPAVLGACRELAEQGCEITVLPVDEQGRVAPAALAAALRDDTALVSIQLANHELGTLQPVAELGALAHARGARFHTDAVQAMGRVPVDLAALGVDLASVSAHKLYGPKGVGALYVRRGIPLAPLFGGGHQERGRRAGTENAAGIAGFGAACALARRELPTRVAQTAALRDRFERGALLLLGARRNGGDAPRVPGTSNVAFAGVDGELLMMSLDLEGVAVSTGAACTSGSLEPSPVVRALGQPAAQAREAVRVSMGSDNSEEEIDAVLALLPALLARIRAAAE
jgi:cysteine desulfurase